MTADSSAWTHGKTEFDDWRSLTIGIYMALAGYAVMVGLPVLSTAWVDKLGLTEVQVGRVAGADLAGLAIGAVLAAIYMAKVDRRYMAVGAAIVAILANVLCVYNQSYEATLWLRLAAGLGAGVYTGIAVATIAGHSRPAFAFSLELLAFAFSQGAELAFLPFLSINQIYWVLVATFVVGLLFINWLPRRPAYASEKVESLPSAKTPPADLITIPSYVPWLVLLAIVFTYINIGAYWTYIELAASESEADPDWVAKILWITSIFSVIGCVFAVLLSNRYGLARPLFVTLILQASIVVMLVTGINNVNIAISMFMFNFFWIFIDVYQASTIANVDRSGQFPALIPAAQGLGNFLGPNLAATVLSYNLGYNGVFILCGLASVVAMFVYLYMYLALRQSIPALADAS